MKLYLSQIAKWLENTTGIAQQIIHTNERDDIRYTDHDSQSGAMGMTIIADGDIEIKSISWSGEYGLGLNTAGASNENGEKVHVILWSDSEISKDGRGYYMDAEDALNGVLVLYNPKTAVTGTVISQMLDVDTPETGVPEADALPIAEDNTPITAFGDKVQALVDEVYSEWQKEENRGKSKWDILAGFPAAHQIAVVFGNFNHQVENGGLEQWIYNGYFHDDAEKLTEYLEAGAELDDRCEEILDRIYKLDQCARETDCDREGNYRDPDGDGDYAFIGDLINCDAFDTWYYGHCGKEDWWETVYGIIEISEGHELAPVSKNEHAGEEAPPIVAFGERPSPYKDSDYSDGPHPDDVINGAPDLPIQVFVENSAHPEYGGFTMPLPATRESLQPFLDGLEITGAEQIAVTDVMSDIDGLPSAITSGNVVGLRLDELNYLASGLQAMDNNEREVFTAVIAAKRHTGSVAEIINLTENLGNFDLQPAFSPKQYGEFLLETGMDEYANAFERVQENDSGFARYIEMLEENFDAEACGRKTAAYENGVFTEFGYLTERGEFREVYRGPGDIPAEYRVVAYPERDQPAAARERPSVMEQIRAAKAQPKQPHKPKSQDKSHGEEL
jgi:hypothetical protein